MTGIDSKPFHKQELSRAAAYGAILLLVNFYICRNIFFNETAYMGSMHGYWIALAKRMGDSWFHARWWPYWDAGIPFEFTYAPLIPGCMALWSSISGISSALALQRITGIVYCLSPLALFGMAWLLTRTPGYSFLAALFYSLVSPTQLLAPSAGFTRLDIVDPLRFYLVEVWDDTPHLAALTMLPLVILSLCLSIQKRRPLYYGLTALLIALATLANLFAPMIIAMASVCLLFVLPRRDLKRNMMLTAGIGCYALALVFPFLPPSLLLAIPRASQSVERGWTLGSLAAAGLVFIGWIALWRFLRRCTPNWTFQFFALFTYLASSATLIPAYLHWQLLPQPDRYKFEMEFGIALVLLFAFRQLDRVPLALGRVLVTALLVLAAVQAWHYRNIARFLLHRADVTQSIEYRASRWINQNLPGVRVMLPGGISQWADAFFDTPQFSGGSWSTAYNPTQQWGFAALRFGGDPNISLAWLQAFGAGAVVVSGPRSAEFWKPFHYPFQFEGRLPVLWSQDDVTIYSVPERSASLAHVVPEAALVRDAPRNGDDVGEVKKYAAALEDPSLPLAAFRWEGANQIRIEAPPGSDALSIQVSYHPGWHASIGGQARPLMRDSLGLMWLRPQCAQPCEIQLDYDGGWELRICRYISFTAIAGLFLIAGSAVATRRSHSRPREIS